MNNTFSNNAAIIHASHGGAISIECDFIDPQSVVQRGSIAPRLKSSEFKKYTYDLATFIKNRETATALAFLKKKGCKDKEADCNDEVR